MKEPRLEQKQSAANVEKENLDRNITESPKHEPDANSETQEVQETEVPEPVKDESSEGETLIPEDVQEQEKPQNEDLPVKNKSMISEIRARKAKIHGNVSLLQAEIMRRKGYQSMAKLTVLEEAKRRKIK